MNIENKLKFFRNVIIGIIGLIIVAFILNTMPGYERDQYIGITDLIINDENKTSKLVNKIIVQENNIYMSLDDISNMFDSNIFYDEENRQIITTGNLKLAMFDIETEQLFINNSVKKASSIKKEEVQYLPINELQEVYNITLKYNKENDVLIIDENEKGIIKATIIEDTQIKYKPRALSKDIGMAKSNEEVNCYYTTSKGWRLIRTESGLLGYIKANTLMNEQIIKTDETKDIQTKTINLSLNNTQPTTIYSDINIVLQIQNWKELNNTKLENEKWVVINDEYFQTNINDVFSKYNSRNQYINTIVEIAKQNNIDAIVLDIKEIEDINDYYRFIIEIAPNLRNNNIKINVVLNDKIKEENIIGVVDYIVRDTMK